MKQLLPTFVDFFAGSGLVTQGVKHASPPVWSNDICPRKAAIYTANHGAGHFHPGSIEEVTFPIILLIAPRDGFRNIAPMNHLALEIEKALPAMEPEAARKFETAVRAMLSLAKRGDSGDSTDFDRLLKEEQALRATMSREGRRFSATDRLSRDELHDRHALR